MLSMKKKIDFFFIKPLLNYHGVPQITLEGSRDQNLPYWLFVDYQGFSRPLIGFFDIVVFKLR